MMQGVVGVVTRNVPDVLCHAAVRARNSAVLLAACTDEEQLASIAALSGQQVVMQAVQVWVPAPLICIRLTQPRITKSS